MRFKLMKFRKMKKLTQEEMANLLGISRPHYSDIENGKTTPSIELGYKLQEVFEVDDALDLLKKE